MTNGEKINTQTPQPTNILIAPLDWGLGHATRCIPISKFLANKGFHVVFAAEGPVADLLRAEFPTAEILPLPGYRLSYSAGGRWRNSLKILFQLPKILISIKQERQWLDMILKRRAINVVISDCRFGLYHKNVFNVLMTHQLAIQSPFSWAKAWFRRWNYRFINRFDECWVPDQKGTPNLAGEISHPAQLPRVPVRYIGCLSRLNRASTNTQFTYHALIILSGPEPQRTVLENMIVKGLPSNKRDGIVIVRGLPGETKDLHIPGSTVFNHLRADELEDMMQKSELVISRSGYTTVMDIMKLGKKSVLIPTPGQPEQEYLGEYLSQQQWCACIPQHQFSLGRALQLAATFSYRGVQDLDMDLYKDEIMNSINNASAARGE